MKSINKFFMIALVMLILFSVSSVFAVQNETIMTDDASDALTIDDESVSEEEVLNTNDDEIISSSEDNDVLSDTGNYNDLQGKIDAGGNVSLDKDYQYALVGSSSDKYLWILSRTPEMPKVQLDRLLQNIAQRGYDLSKLIFVEQ